MSSGNVGTATARLTSLLDENSFVELSSGVTARSTDFNQDPKEAAGDGVVLEVIPDVDYGYCIRIDHQNGYITEYYTSSTPLIKEGDSVLQGAILALVEGKNAKLIYKIYQDGKQIDPMEVIKIDG